MKWLQSKDKFKEICLIDENEVFSDIVDRSSIDLSQSLSGTFSLIDGKQFMAFYRWNGQLTISLNGDSRIRIFDEITSRILNMGARDRLFELLQGGFPIFELRYKSYAEDLIPDCDISAFVEEEDFDFPLFIHNVLSVQERRSFIYKGGGIANG